MRPLIVMKFGGSSVADADKMKKVATRIIEKKAAGNDVVVVVSAMGDTTDHLIELAKSVSDDPPDREMDMLMATGEQVSMAVLAMTIRAMGHDAVSLTGPQCEIFTDSSHRRARIVDIKATRVMREVEKGRIVIVAGFQGLSEDGEITTLGRGGSDTTAVALAYALKADVCEILTDVPGVFTADPRVVKNARKVDVIAFDEMLELASMGAKVLNSRSVELASKYDVVIKVGLSHVEAPGTIIKKEDESMEQVLVRGVAHDLDQVKLTVRRVPDQPGVAAKIFTTLTEKGINVDMIIQNVSEDGHTDLSFTVSTSDIEKISTIMNQIKNAVNAQSVTSDINIAKVSIVGVGMRSHAGVAQKVFKVLGDHGINIKMISTSEIKISVVVDKDRANDAVIALHDAFGLGNEKGMA